MQITQALFQGGMKLLKKSQETIPENHYAATSQIITLFKIGNYILKSSKEIINETGSSGNINKNKNEKFEIRNDPQDYLYYEQDKSPGSFYDDTYVHESDENEKYEPSNIGFGYNIPGFKNSEDDENEEIEKNHFPKSKYKEFLEDLGDTVENEIEEENNNQYISAARDQILTELSFKYLKYNETLSYILDSSEELKNSKIYDQINSMFDIHFLPENTNIFDKIKKAKEYFEYLKNFDEIIRFQETVAQGKLKKDLIEIEKMNEFMLEALDNLTEEFENPWERAEKIEKKDKKRQDEEYSLQIQNYLDPVEPGEIDWRPTETIPEDYYAI